MEFLSKQPTVKAPLRDVHRRRLVRRHRPGRGPSRMRVNVVRFAPGARNAWHRHALGQTLHVTEGRGLIQSRGGEVVEIGPGDTVHTPPGEWHWHGAARPLAPRRGRRVACGVRWTLHSGGRPAQNGDGSSCGSPGRHQANPGSR
jgi:quercetin dioxygenase-like cupin family protein